MNMNIAPKSVIEGVDRAVSFWLYDHPVSFPPMVSEAITAAVTGWLDEHSKEIIEAIAKKGVEAQPKPSSVSNGNGVRWCPDCRRNELRHRHRYCEGCRVRRRRKSSVASKRKCRKAHKEFLHG